jgi:metallophosphoesterase (TIGR00282 family)
MKILYIGDVMGAVGLETVESLLPDILKRKQIDLAIAQAENLSDGKGIKIADFRRLQKAGVDFCSGGNWSLYNEEIWPLMSDPNEPIVRPANYPKDYRGLGYKYITKNSKKTLVVSLLGHIVGKDADKPIDNPLKVIDTILESNKDKDTDAVVVNFHGDYSSEKVIIGHYLDGRVSAVVGDHWHVPTADARVLPKGTAHISDVGMCGILNASLGVSLDSVIARWRDNIKTRNELETKGPRQFNAVLVNINDQGLATSIEQIQEIIE